MDKKRIESLDALRGFAAIAFVLRHYTTIFNFKFNTPLNFSVEFKYGYLGVELFFLISGFVIFMSIEQIQSIKEFIIKRFVRLYPTYWIPLFLTSLVILISGVSKLAFSKLDFLLNLTVIQDLFIPILHNKHIDGVYWSLAAELLFYGFILCLYQFKLLKHIQIIGFLWLLSSIICIPNDYSIFMIGVLLNMKWSPLFFGGMMFYTIWKDELERKKWTSHFLIGFSLISYYILTLTKATDPLKSSIEECIVVTGFFFTFYLLSFEKITFLSKSKILLFLGKISYPLYLIHQNIGYIILLILVQQFNLINQVIIIVPILISIGLTMLIVYKFEMSI